MSRRRARELAFRALFGAARGDEPLLDAWADIRADLTEQTPGEAEEAYGEPLGAEGLAFAERLVRAFADNQSELDGRLSGVLEGWTFAQMSQTDLAVLRLALTEMTYEDLPPEVTFEVAVRIAKRYGGEESGRFVNGVLARLHRDRQKSGGQEINVQNGNVQDSARERDATQNPEVQTGTRGLTIKDSAAANADFQGEAPVSDAAQPNLENPDLESLELENPGVGAAEVNNPDPEDSDLEDSDLEDSDLEDSDLEDSDFKDSDFKDSDARLASESDPRDRDVVEG